MQKKLITIILCVCMLLPFGIHVRAADQTMTTGSWNETIWVEIPDLREEEITAVTWTGTDTGSLTGADFEYLVRNVNGGVRIDILGLTAGTYNLTVTTKAGTLTQTGIIVDAQDRSGYAHFGDTEGVGAYTNDGKLKENAIVLYVTEQNKETVSVTSKDGTTVTGIGNILNTVGMDTGRGTSSKGGKANTNQDILRKLAADGTPLVVRIIGKVTAPSGLTAYDGVDYGGSVGDNGFMARMSGGKDITIEGVGTDASIDGWGLHFICQSSDYTKGWGRSFEVRNISFRNVPEDCVGMEGQQTGDVLTAPVERCWIHNCAFYGPKIANPAESDKDGGDGACDFKRGQYFTNSYCYYEGYHKTNLVGSSDSSPQYHMTYHHNYWKNCESRGPLARQANIHMYNNIFENQSSYCMNPRANAYIFSEYNLFTNCKSPVTVKLGAVKSYGDSFQNCRGDNHATIVTDKATPVSTNCKYANFDTNPNLSYIPSGDYYLQESITEMKAVVLANAGPQKGTSTDDGGNDDQPGDPDDFPTFPAGSYIHNFTVDGIASEFFSITGNLSTSKGTVTYADLTLTQCLKIESSTSISFHAPESGTLVLIFGGTTDATGKTIKIDGIRYTIGNNSILTTEIAKGSHTITKGDSIHLFYMAYISQSATEEQPHTHSYESQITTGATCNNEGIKTYRCDCGDSYTETIPATEHQYETREVAPTCSKHGSRNTICIHCGDGKTEIIPATGEHNYGQWVTTEQGRTRTCETCGNTQTEENLPEVPTEPTAPSEPTTPSPESSSVATTPSTMPEPSTTPNTTNQNGNVRNGMWIVACFAVLLITISTFAWLLSKKKSR